jgi:arylsulfatase A-like enzyme
VRRTGAVLLGGALAAGCARPPESVVYDLARDAERAELRLPESVEIRLAPPAAVRPGLRLLRQRGDDDEAAGVRYERTAFVSWRGLAPRDAVLDLEGARGKAVVFLNEVELARVSLQAGRHRYRVPLPPDAQARRHNRLRVVVPERAELRGVKVASGGSAGGAGGQEPPVLESRRDGDVTTLAQAGPGALRFALRLPEAAELRFTPVALGDGGAGARLRVSFELAGTAERDVWSADLAKPGSTNEAVIPLPGSAGSLAAVSLHVDSLARAGWRAPRVIGRGDGDGLAPHARGTAEDARAEPLRRALSAANVVLVVLDAASALHFHCYGYGRATTPEIDRLAAEGVLFEQAYTPAVYTVSAVSSLWTSLYHEQHHAGVRHSEPLPAGPLTVPELLQVRGVHTAGFVANPSAGRPFGLDRGFLEFHEPYREGGRFVGVPRAEAFHPLLERFLAERRAGGRFLAYVHFLEPHFPYDPPSPFRTMFGPDAPLPASAGRSQDWIRAVNGGTARATPAQHDHLVRLYDANLAAVDHELGRLREMLEGGGLLDDTVLIVAADHGEALGEHGFIGHAPQVYEEAVHIPLILRFPKGVVKAGTRVDGLADLLDLGPTLLDVFGVRWPEALPGLQGRSLLPMIGGAPGKPAVFSRSMAERPVFGVREGRFKFVHSLRDGASELYDIEADPAEKSDLSDSQPLRVEFYRQALYRWLDRLERGHTLPQPSPTPVSEEDRAALRALGYVQ